MTLVETVKKNAKTAKWTGIFLVIAGFLALLSPFAAGLSVALIVGVLLIVSGVGHLLVVFGAGSIGEGILLAVLALLSIVAGAYMVSQPVSALAALTLFLAAYFIVSGIIEIIAALGARPADGWGWVLFGGIVSLLLGLMIWRQFPLSGAWAVGILFGVRMLVGGWTLIALGSAVKDMAQAAEQ